MTGKVVTLASADTRWNFDTNNCELSWRSGAGYNHVQVVDPCPCYQHDGGLVAEMLSLCTGRFPVGPSTPTIYIAPLETIGRSNGCTHHDYDYNDPAYGQGRGKAPYRPTIVLWGKRIPPHPGMTRYLVTHEYGHVAEEVLWVRLGFRSKAEFQGFYAGFRGHRADIRSYGPGTWHLATGELVANDFRICVCNTEPEYWPHPGVAHPDGLKQIRELWCDWAEAFRLDKQYTTKEEG